MKKKAIHVGVLAAIFIIAVVVFEYMTTRGNDDMMEDLGNAVLPRVYFTVDGYGVNALNAYSEEMDITTMRDSVTPISGKKLTMNLEADETKVTAVDYAVYTLDGKKKLSEDKISKVKDQMDLSFDQNLLSEERMLVLTLHADGKSVYYYTRIVNPTDFNLTDCLDYVYNFHENALKKVENAGVGAALEQDDEDANSTFSHVTIHSSYDQVTWGNLAPQVTGGERWKITETNSSYTSVLLEYDVSCTGEENETDMYTVREFFRVRKNNGQMYLLNYDRTMEQIFDGSKNVLSEKGILLGITLLSWFFTSVIHGNKKIVIYTLLLLTVGTMLQCIFREEQVLKNPQYYETHNPAAALQFQYILGFVMALVAAFLYLNCKNLSSTKALKKLNLSSVKVCRIFFYFSLFLSVITLALAKSVGNVRNWITIGGVSLQTTEFIKFLYVFIAAGLLGTKENPDKENIRAFYIVTFIEVLFLALQSEFGTMLLILMLFLTFIFLFIPDIRYFIGTVLVMAAGSLGLSVVGMQLTKWKAAGVFLGTNKIAQIFLSNYNKIANRFIYWLHPEKDALGLGYQLLKAKESIVLGGWFGTSSVTELPVKTSDLVYPALIQRCGMVFALLVFIVFIMMWLEGVQLFVRKQDRYHRAVGAGFVFMLFDQTLIIIAGSTGLCPLTGITLPFISSGGSSLMISFMIVGLIVAVSSNVKWKGTLEDEEEQDKFFKENAVTAKCHTYLRHLNDHFPRKSFRVAAGRVRRSGQKEESGEGKGV